MHSELMTLVNDTSALNAFYVAFSFLKRRLKCTFSWMAFFICKNKHTQGGEMNSVVE